uniref:Uncharacterized protein n=2 Tax=Anopheles merus TaxID=30066 RepID=A0A182UMW1_ANOME
MRRKKMSLQVSNQTTSGRRTPQVYQGFGNMPAGATTTPTATNGSGTTGAGGSVGRAAKGGGAKQSQIPVAIGSGGGFGTPGNDGSVPQTAVVYPGTAGATDGSSGQKQVQSDHMYGMKQQQQQQQQPAASANSATNRSATNGSQLAASVEKNGTSQRKNSTGEGGAKKTESAAASQQQQQQPSVPAAEGTAKVRDSPRSSGRAQQKQTVEEAAPANKTMETQQQPKSEKTTNLESSLLTEKTLKGFGSDGEEMESLLLEPWDMEEGSTTPSRSSAAKSKLPKAAPQAQARVSPFKASGKTQPKPSGGTATTEPEQTAGSPNKKTAAAAAGDESEKNRSPKVDAPSTPTAGESLIGRPLRSISGRRSTRPISDIKFTHPRRSTADPHNDSISSMNVTVGSEIGSDSMLLRTPGSATRKRKDMTPESTSDEPVIDSPKRARLDFSGFLGMVATPVTMLKNRLSRVKLQSTPRALAVDEEDASKVVTAEATTTTASVTPQKEADGVGAMDVDVVAGKGAEKSDDATAPVADGQKEGAEGQQQQQQESSSSVAEDDEVEVKIVTDQPQQPKQWCSIM